MDQLLDYILHFDAYLKQAVEALGLWAYLAIFATIFAETGLVVAPFLPGESLLLTSGTLAGAGVLHIAVLWPLLVGAAFLGDVVNYLIGRWLGKHLLSKPRKYLKPEHVQEAHEFYEEHGGLAIVACRFLPIVRTLVPFVAGMTRMEFHRYLAFAALAAVLWVTIFLGAGYLFGNIQWVQDYLAVALAIAVAASAIPGFIIWGAAPPAAGTVQGELRSPGVARSRRRCGFRPVLPAASPRTYFRDDPLRSRSRQASSAAPPKRADHSVTRTCECERMLAHWRTNRGER